MVTPIVFAYMMSKVDRRIGATHYTLLASVEVRESRRDTV